MPSGPAADVIPFQERFPAERWPVALLAVAAGTDLDGAFADLATGLAGVRDHLARLTDPQTYDADTR